MVKSRRAPTCAPGLTSRRGGYEKATETHGEEASAAVKHESGPNHRQDEEKEAISTAKIPQSQAEAIGDEHEKRRRAATSSGQSGSRPKLPDLPSASHSVTRSKKHSVDRELSRSHRVR
jgi:hypothetical protein